MIVTFLLNVIIMIFSVVFYVLPVVTIATIPIIGESVSETLYLMVSYWNSFMLTFPYAEVGWEIFILIIVPFEIGLVIAKFFLGSRTPAETVVY